jgi:hypothetical protein
MSTAGPSGSDAAVVDLSPTFAQSAAECFNGARRGADIGRAPATLAFVKLGAQNGPIWG